MQHQLTTEKQEYITLISTHCTTFPLKYWDNKELGVGHCSFGNTVDTLDKVELAQALVVEDTYLEEEERTVEEDMVDGIRHT